MEIQKFNAAIEQTGYNPFGITGINRDEDAQIFAEKNGISVEEAKEILKIAEEKAEENDRIMAQESALMAELLNDQDEEEIEIVEDFDFDNFLKEESSEQKMQDMLNKQQYLNNNASDKKQENKNNPFAPDKVDFMQDANPFLKMKW